MEQVKMLPSVLVDRLPVNWWHPGNLQTVGEHRLHFCDDDHVRSIEWDGRLIAQGKRLFPYGHWDPPRMKGLRADNCSPMDRFIILDEADALRLRQRRLPNRKGE